jgi:hypothetical protein
MRGRMASVSPSEQIIQVTMMVSLAVVVLMLRDVKARFSLKWLFAFTTVLAVFCRTAAIFFGGLIYHGTK